MSTHNYSELYDEYEVEMLQDMDNAITKSELWDWMKTYEPEEGKGFMFSEHPNLDLILKNSSYGGHNGSSYGWTMRTMQNVAQMGWNKFRYYRLATKKFKKTVEYIHLSDMLRESSSNSKSEKYFEDLIDQNIKHIADEMERNDKSKVPDILTFAESMRNTSPDGEKQYQAIKNFSDGKISYAEMRGICG